MCMCGVVCGVWCGMWWVHLIMGPCPCGHDPTALHLCTGHPKLPQDTRTRHGQLKRHHEHDESRPQDPKSTFVWKCVEMFKSRVVVVWCVVLCYVWWSVREKDNCSTNRS